MEREKDSSSVCMFSIINLPDINEEYGREMGNETVIKVSENIKNSISEEYLFVRYMGPKFIIFFSGVENDGVIDFLQDLKKDVENIKINSDVGTENKKKKKKDVYPKLNLVVTTYYKGTALESLNKKLEEYIDNADPDESDINLI